MEQTVSLRQDKLKKQCSETSAYKIQTPGNYPEESVQHSKEGESLKSRTLLSSQKWFSLHLIPFHTDGHLKYQKYLYLTLSRLLIYFQDQSRKTV